MYKRQELIGLRPVISAVGTTNIVEKVRGNAAILTTMVKFFKEPVSYTHLVCHIVFCGRLEARFPGRAILYTTRLGFCLLYTSFG